MRQILILIKYGIINKLKLEKLSKGKKISLGLFFVLISLGVFAFAFLYMLLMAKSFNEINMTELIILLSVVTSQIMILITTIPQIDSTLFHGSDYEMLQAMPIKKVAIVSSKLILLLTMSYIVTILMVLTSYISYMCFCGFSVSLLLKLLVVIIINPLISFSLSILVSILITRISLNFKYKKIFSTVTSLLFIITIIVVMLFISRVDGDNYEEVYNTYINIFSHLSYPGYLLYLGSIKEVKYLVIISVISIVLFILTLYIISKNYTKLIYLIKSKEHTKQKKKNNKVTPKLFSLIKLEYKKYFYIPSYVLNTLISPILGCLFLVFFIINLADVKLLVPQITNYLDFTLLIMIVLFSTVSPQTAATISLEKNTLWIYKTMPIKETKIFMAKTICCISLTLPFTIINSIICIVSFKTNFYLSLGLLITPILLVILVSNIGLVINLKFPSLKWTNAIEAIKQSKSVLFSMLSGFLLTILTIVSAIFFSSFFFLPNYFGILITDIILLVLVVLSFILLNKYGVRKFREIVC